MSARSEKNQIVIFDTTLRDGEQSPGASMNLDEKLRIAEVLEGMGVDIIEAGFPIASDGDFEAVSEVAKLVGVDTPTIDTVLALVKLRAQEAGLMPG